MQSITIETNDGSIEARSDYSTGNSRLAGQDGALTLTFDSIETVDGGDGLRGVRVYRGGTLVTSLTVPTGEADRLIGFLSRADNDTVIEGDA